MTKLSQSAPTTSSNINIPKNLKSIRIDIDRSQFTDPNGLIEFIGYVSSDGVNFYSVCRARSWGGGPVKPVSSIGCQKPPPSAIRARASIQLLSGTATIAATVKTIQ